jgi:hypothetical protein
MQKQLDAIAGAALPVAAFGLALLLDRRRTLEQLMPAAIALLEAQWAGIDAGLAEREAEAQRAAQSGTFPAVGIAGSPRDQGTASRSDLALLRRLLPTLAALDVSGWMDTLLDLAAALDDARLAGTPQSLEAASAAAARAGGASARLATGISLIPADGMALAPINVVREVASQVADANHWLFGSTRDVEVETERLLDGLSNGPGVAPDTVEQAVAALALQLDALGLLIKSRGRDLADGILHKTLSADAFRHSLGEVRATLAHWLPSEMNMRESTHA